MRMKRSKIVVAALLVGTVIYGGGAILALVRAENVGWTETTLAQMAWPLLRAVLFGVSALMVYRKNARK
jgi:hypothetical protein